MTRQDILDKIKAGLRQMDKLGIPTFLADKELLGQKLNPYFGYRECQGRNLATYRGITSVWMAGGADRISVNAFPTGYGGKERLMETPELSDRMLEGISAVIDHLCRERIAERERTAANPRLEDLLPQLELWAQKCAKVTGPEYSVRLQFGKRQADTSRPEYHSLVVYEDRWQIGDIPLHQDSYGKLSYNVSKPLCGSWDTEEELLPERMFDQIREGVQSIVGKSIHMNYTPQMAPTDVELDEARLRVAVLKIQNASMWENECARRMTRINMEVVKQKYPPSAPGMAKAFGNAKVQLLSKALDIIREVERDEHGALPLDPDEWRRLYDRGDVDNKARTVFVMDKYHEDLYEVPPSLAENVQKLLEVGIRPEGVLSGRIVDTANLRDGSGFPQVFTAPGRPLSQLSFRMGDTLSSAKYLTDGQAADIRQAARENGWCVIQPAPCAFALTLPVTPSGKSVEEIVDQAERNGTSWEDEMVKEGGQVMYTDKELADAWNRLTDGIVQKATERIGREDARITDVDIREVIDRTAQVRYGTISCKVDGVQQQPRRMGAVEYSNYRMSLLTADAGHTDFLKREAARGYFNDVLNPVEQKRGLKL